jgi:hypothetical protein
MKLALILYGLWAIYLMMSTWVFYVAAMGLKRLEKDGGEVSKMGRYFIYILGPIGMAHNFLLSHTVGAVLFLQFLNPLKYPLFTDRMIHNLSCGSAWREQMASYFCRKMLSPYDPASKGHCPIDKDCE